MTATPSAQFPTTTWNMVLAAKDREGAGYLDAEIGELERLLGR